MNVMSQPHAAAPRVAVVVPIFRHSVLAGEAIHSALDQEADFGIHIVLVNDGCPHRETDMLCRDFALAYPDTITYLRKPNGGLSDARNHGIGHVLKELPSVEAIYMLDADNRLRPPAMARAMAALDADPEVGWIYPHIDMFGTPWAGDYGGAYSLLVHTAMNICEAGSLIRREVFEAGIVFDTDFKLGFEDWDFFLTAAQAGFRGRNIDGFGFRYRKRPESMLSDSERDAAAIRGAMGLKHKELFRPRNTVTLEHEEAPRYAIWTPGQDGFLLATDPEAAPRKMSLEAYDKLVWNTQVSRTRHHLPPYLVVVSSGALELLRRGKCLHWALWKLERMIPKKGIAALTLSRGTQDGHAFVEHPASKANRTHAAAMMVHCEVLKELLEAEKTQWIDTLVAQSPQVPSAALELKLPAVAKFEPGPRATGATYEFLSLLQSLRASPWRGVADRKWEWREPGLPWRPRSHEIARQSFGGVPSYPRVQDGRRHIGFALPLVAFGGVEKVALNMARGMRAHGWVPHLFVIGAQEGAISAEWREVFESVNFLADAGFKTWGGGGAAFMGTEVPGWAGKGDHGPALAMMSWLDAVVSMHTGALAGIMGKLRRFGVTTVSSLHLSDLSDTGRPKGNTYLSLAYEHAYDIFAPCSQRLGEWCHALGVPAEKIVPVPNAPGFPISAEALRKAHERRARRAPDAPLRVMYLGRLDRQKGLQRLGEVIRRCEAEELEVEWRVIGDLVVPAGAVAPDPALAHRVEPAMTTHAALNAAFDWADALVLLSDYEGLPLTILEAMRSGVVPLATDVGAVSEVLRDDENGVLLPLEGAAAHCLDTLRDLARDREKLGRLSARAVQDMQARDWVAATTSLSHQLGSKTPPKSVPGRVAASDTTENPPQPKKAREGNTTMEGYVFVVTYGRSGSTLLQSYLNSFDGYCIRGENGNILSHLASIANIVDTEDNYTMRREDKELPHDQRKWFLKPIMQTPSDPWFGVENVDQAALADSLRSLFVTNFLNPPAGTRVAGCKEIRWMDLGPDFFPKFLGQVEAIFPKTRFLFLKRNAADVAKSSFWGNHPAEKVRDFVATSDRAFSAYAEGKENCLVLSYEKMTASTDCFEQVADFLGERFDRDQAQGVLGHHLKH